MKNKKTLSSHIITVHKSRARLLQQQRERRERLKQTPGYKEQTRIYNERCRGRSLAAAYMVEYYHRGKERISEQRKRSYQRARVGKKEQQRIYNERYRDMSLAAAHMVEYYHRSKERISELRTRNYQHTIVEEKERRRLQRRERRRQAKLLLPEGAAAGDGAGRSRSYAWA